MVSNQGLAHQRSLGVALEDPVYCGDDFQKHLHPAPSNTRDIVVHFSLTHNPIFSSTGPFTRPDIAGEKQAGRARKRRFSN
jgi:hypothetical protein